MAERLWRCQDDHRSPRSSHPSLRDPRDRQRQLAVQEPPLTPNLSERPPSMRCATLMAPRIASGRVHTAETKGFRLDAKTGAYFNADSHRASVGVRLSKK